MNENVEYTKRINQQLDKNLAELERKRIEWEAKNRKMEEDYMKKNQERQEKLIEEIKNLKLDNNNHLRNKKNIKNSSNNNDINLRNDNNNDNSDENSDNNSNINSSINK